MDDEQLVGLFLLRSEDAIAEAERKYGRYCRAVAYNILGSREDSEECVSDALCRAWDSIPPNKPESMSAYLGRLTRNLALNRLEKLNAEKRGAGQTALALEELAECVPSENSVEREVDGALLTEAINRFLASLSVETRRIFVLRYWQLEPVKDISAALGISESKVKMTLLRTRRKLKTALEREDLQ